MNTTLRILLGISLIAGTASAIERTATIDPPTVAQIGKDTANWALAPCCDPIPQCPPVCAWPTEAN